MGGYSSGRHRTRTRGSINEAYRIEMKWVRRRGFLWPGAIRSGTWSWTRNGEPSGSIGLAIVLSDPEKGSAVLEFTHDGQARRQVVRLEAVPCRYGGRRYYFICPKTGRRCEVLCCVAGYFASRQYHGLAYGSQSEDPWDRLLRARNKAESALFGKDGRPKPRGSSRERKLQKWIDLEEACDRRLDMLAASFRARFGDELGF